MLTGLDRGATWMARETAGCCVRPGPGFLGRHGDGLAGLLSGEARQPENMKIQDSRRMERSREDVKRL